MIPDGPLHPADAVLALGWGLAVAAVAFRSMRWWPPLVVAAAVTAMTIRYPGSVTGGLIDRPYPVAVIAMVFALSAAAWWSTSRFEIGVWRVVPLVMAMCAAVWAFVPDTEAPLVAGVVLIGAAVRPPRGSDARTLGILWVLPIGAAAIGSVGVPSRMAPAIAFGAAVAISMLTIQAGAVLAVRRIGRAGAPATTVSGATSSHTTDPAPTTAP